MLFLVKSLSIQLEDRLGVLRLLHEVRAQAHVPSAKHVFPQIVRDLV